MKAHMIELLWRLGRFAPNNQDLTQTLVGAEVGVYKAELSETLLRAYPNLTLHMIDPWCHHPEGTRYAKTGDVRAKRTQEWWDGLLKKINKKMEFAKERAKIMRETSVEAAEKIKDFSLDFVFIDGDHSYEAVCEDIRIWTPKVRAGGLVGGHDYDNPLCPQVKKAVDEFKATGVNLGLGFTWWFTGT